MNTGAAVFLKIEGKTDISSPCGSTYNTVSSDQKYSIIQWQPVGDCVLPMVKVGGKNYILPINGRYPDEAILSDVSSETLRNTLRA